MTQTARCETCGADYDASDLQAAFRHVHVGAQWAALLDPAQPVRIVVLLDGEEWGAGSPDLPHFILRHPSRSELIGALPEALEQYCGRPVTIRLLTP